MTDHSPESDSPRATTEQGIVQVRRQLAAIDAAIDSLRLSGGPVPESLTVERYELSRRLASLERTLIEADEVARRGTKEVVFVIMPFKPPFNDYYKSVIRPAVSDAGFEVTRSDEIYGTRAFIQKIWSGILRAEAIIAEMTGSNPNVLYELGLSHAIGRKVIMVTQNIDNVPSDLRHINCIVYDTALPNWADQLRNEIQRMLLFDRSSKDYSVLSPVASIDNAELFNHLDQQVREWSLRAREREAELQELHAHMEAVAGERDQYKASLRDRLVPDKQAGTLVSVSSDSEITVATVPMPVGKEVLEFVPVVEGEFIFGSSTAAETASLPAYWITRFSITNSQYCEFLNEIGLRSEGGVPWIDLSGKSPADKCRIKRNGSKFSVEKGYEDYPITYINYYGATAFCEWVGGALPSVEQWEKAARGIDGNEYPWGASPPNPDVANIGASGWPRDVAPISVRAKQAGMSPFGLVQAIGNVRHWTSTYYPDRGVQAVRGGPFFEFRLGRRGVYRFHVEPDGPDMSQGLIVVKRFLGGSE
jgi:formylglycine-generating enzyme required for sulfatase activity